MIGTLRKEVRWFLILSLGAMAVCGILITLFPREGLNNSVEVFFWILMAMFAFMITMADSGIRDSVRNDRFSLRELVILSCSFGVMNLFASLSVGVHSAPMGLNFAFIVAMMAGFVGGPVLGLFAAVIGTLTHLVLLDADMHIMEAIIVMMFSGIVSGLWAVHSGRRTDGRSMYAVPIVITVFATMIEAGAHAYAGTLYESLPEILIRLTIPTLVAASAGAFGFRLIMKFIEFGSDALRNSDDLKVAHDIQMSSVPVRFPGKGTVEFGTRMDPANVVAGDFYDVFEIREGLIGMVIADVSGKGLPACLFMMRAQTTIRTIAMTGLPPHEVLRRSNQELCQRNDVEQFVTAWIGVLDTDTGELSYSNAGHTPPYIFRDGAWSRLECPRGLVLGASKKASYQTMTIGMEHNDAVFLYTDGLNEAFDVHENQFGHERIISSLGRCKGMEPQDTVDGISADLDSFTDGAEKSDDVTILCFRYRGDRKHISTVSDKSKLDGIIEEIHGYLVSEGCPEKTALKMDIVTEELFVNICNYSYGESEGNVDIYYAVTDSVMELTFVDSGVPFDPTGKGEVVLGEDISSWPIGGLGVHMSLKLTDSAHYKRYMGRNIFTVRKKVLGAE